VAGFPNFLMAMGPHAGLSNYTRTAEYSVEWVTGVIRFASERGLGRIEATGGQAFFTGDMIALERAFTRISEELKSQYIITYKPANQNYDGRERKIDFSAFAPRGHYAADEHESLKPYFRSAMWLSRGVLNVGPGDQVPQIGL